MVKLPLRVFYATVSYSMKEYTKEIHLYIYYVLHNLECLQTNGYNKSQNRMLIS